MTWNGNLTARSDNEVDTRFENIERMEEKRNNFIKEQTAIHEATVKEWDMLYAAICKLAEKYEASDSFRQSQMARNWFQKSSVNAITTEWKRGG